MAAALTRRGLGGAVAGSVFGASGAARGTSRPGGMVNAPRDYPVTAYDRELDCVVDAASDLGTVDRRIFGTNLEWFNDAGGLADPEASEHLTALARQQHLSVLRFPGGTLADYYHWRDGTGPRAGRPVVRHPTDSGRSANRFGSPEFFALLKATGAEGLITVNAGTSTPRDAAEWVAYANQPGNAARAADGVADPAGIKLWEVGNELYLPGNPGELKITQSPEAYAAHFAQFADAMREADPAISVIAIGTAKSREGPDTQFPDWSEKLLAAAADKIDMIAVHNAYFPLPYGERQSPVELIYKALWAAPDAVDRSLSELSALIGRFETGRKIGIAVTEWGALFSLPQFDPYWFDHVKTIGSGIYVARMLQVFMSQPRLKLANYFKFVDRSFLGWVNYAGRPKVPFWVFQLYAEASGGRRLAATVDSPTYDAPASGVMLAQRGVPEVTVLATRAAPGGTLFVNLVNRSMSNSHRVRLTIRDGGDVGDGEVRSVSAHEPTAHNGVDIPPEWPMKPEYEPYSTAAPDSIRIESRKWRDGDPVALPPFSVATLLLRPSGG